MDASNATLYCAISADGVTRRLRLQAGRGGAAALGLPGRHAGRARGRRLHRLGGIRLDDRAADGLPRRARPARAWCSSGSPRTRPPTSCRMIRRRDSDELRRIAVFDAVINNADRKGGHLLPTTAGHVYGVDHGVSFHVEDKLRTVLWQWAGRPLPDDAQDMLRRLRRDLDGRLGEQLAELLTTARGAPHAGPGRPAAVDAARIPSRATTGRRCPGRRCSCVRRRRRCLSATSAGPRSRRGGPGWP